MATASSVPRVKAALLTAMRAALGSVQAEWDFPGQDIVAKETAYMGSAEFDDEKPAALRTSPRQHDESYTVPIHVEVVADGNDVQAAETRMWTLVGLVEDAIRNDESLGSVTGLHWAVVGGKAPFNYLSDQGRACHCAINVKCHARI